jgi:hypothetical protein
MMPVAATATLSDMTVDSGIHTFVLRELRLRHPADANEAARIVAASPSANGPSVPLLISIDDERDVAVVRALRAGETPDSDSAQRRSLAGLVTMWQPPQRYIPRITERTTARPTHYRLAVTESGINNPGSDPPTAIPVSVAGDTTPTALDLLWIGVPLGTFAGLLILLGSDDADAAPRPGAEDWPLPLSRYLGVRIYDSRR